MLSDAKIMPSETDVVPMAISGTGWNWVGSNLGAGLIFMKI